MGLDIVELVMEVEDAFDVQIPDDRAGQMRTVGELYDFIVESKRETVNPRRTCLSAATFVLEFALSVSFTFSCAAVITFP